jgi:hypothetical protein
MYAHGVYFAKFAESQSGGQQERFADISMPKSEVTST